VSTQQASKSVWKTDAAGRTTFRLTPPLVLWWVWAAFAAANLADLVIQSRDWFALQITFALLLVTGFMYACALRPRVITDATSLTILNPFRDYQVPWTGVEGIFVGDSVEFQCQQPAPRPLKTIYSWALYSPRRARARAELRATAGVRRQRYEQRAQRRFQAGVPGEPAGYGKLPAQAKDLAAKHPSHAMASELARRCNEARAADPAIASGTSAGTATSGTDRVGGTLTRRWAWLPIAAVIIPAAGLIAVIVGH
jgi:hypothetical protein